MRHTLLKSNILRGYQSFSRVISNGKSIRGVYLAGYVLTQPSEKPCALIGFTVSKKRMPQAVDRNRVKRLMREAVRKHFSAIVSRTVEKKLAIEIVLSYTGEKKQKAQTLMLNNIEPEWIELQQRMMEMV